MTSSTSVPSTDQIRGWTLPTTLFCLALLLSSIHLLTFESVDARRMIAERTIGRRLHQEAVSAVKAHLSTGQRCRDISVSNESSPASYEVCGEELRPFNSVPSMKIDPATLIDYDVIFLSAVNCPVAPVLTTLSQAIAPRARNDCLLPPTLRDGAVVLENIRGENLTISPPSGTSALLASPGSTTVLGELTITANLLIVSGGDVEIGGIRGTSPSSITVTIISSLGSIHVGKTYGPVSLVVAGRSTLEVPETPQPQSFPMPPLRTRSIRSFRAVTRDAG
jgi:hypothetical protein